MGLKVSEEYVTQKYDLDSKSISEIKALLANTNTVVSKDKDSSTNRFHKIGCLEERACIARVLAEKQRSIDESVMLAEFNARLSVWNSLGKPSSMLRNENGILGFDMLSEVQK